MIYVFAHLVTIARLEVEAVRWSAGRPNYAGVQKTGTINTRPAVLTVSLFELVAIFNAYSSFSLALFLL